LIDGYDMNCCIVHVQASLESSLQVMARRPPSLTFPTGKTKQVSTQSIKPEPLRRRVGLRRPGPRQKKAEKNGRNEITPTLTCSKFPTAFCRSHPFCVRQSTPNLTLSLVFSHIWRTRDLWGSGYKVELVKGIKGMRDRERREGVEGRRGEVKRPREKLK
jgi:hypothetical protein